MKHVSLLVLSLIFITSAARADLCASLNGVYAAWYPGCWMVLPNGDKDAVQQAYSGLQVNSDTTSSTLTVLYYEGWKVQHIADCEANQITFQYDGMNGFTYITTFGADPSRPNFFWLEEKSVGSNIYDRRCLMTRTSN